MKTAHQIEVLLDHVKSGSCRREIAPEMIAVLEWILDIEPVPGTHLPKYCYGCGTFLMGSLTRHTADCPIRALIAQQFPDYEQPAPPEDSHENNDREHHRNH